MRLVRQISHVAQELYGRASARLARERAVAEFGLEGVLARYEALYGELADEAVTARASAASERNPAPRGAPVG